MKLRDFFYFNRSDRSVLLFLLSLGVVATALIFFVGGQDTITEVGPLDSLPTSSSYSMRRVYEESGFAYREEAVARPELFAFDPNTADSTQLLRLGLKPWQVRNIYHYRARGGIFRKPSDFARIYGLTRGQYRQLEPYIRISDDYIPAATLFADDQPMEAPRDTTHRYPTKLKAHERVELNSADTSLLQRVPGIGSYFARQVTRYRERLGGFADVRQLLEIEDFPASALSYFTIADQPRKLKVNQLTLNELKRHPYLNYYTARAIVDYRRLRGPLKSLDDLRLLPDFTARDLERLKPYVEF
ncbi:MAG: helix-hairpin-helix domain-containing protein [Prevotella sp.]|nr:helix-hairpin-helix domain-containing protein [Prevotella sp.]